MESLTESPMSKVMATGLNSQPERRTHSRSTALRRTATQGKYVGINGGMDLYVRDGILYRVNKTSAVAIGDWFQFCYIYRRNRARGTLPASCRLFHIDGN